MADITLQQAAQLIKGCNNALILSHAKPDGDTIGSAMGLREIMHSIGKSADIVCDDDLGERLRRVFSTENFPAENIDAENYDLIIAVDVAELSLAGDFGEKYADAIDLKIDHHANGAHYAKDNYIDGTAAATGEIIYSLAKIFGVVNTEAFGYLYAAIASDTGGFKYSNVTPFTFRTAAEMLEAGVDCAYYNHQLFECISQREVAATVLAYTSLKYHLDGHLATIFITNEMKEAAGVEDEDLGNVSSLPRRIMGVDLSVVMKQKTDEPKRVTISMRSSEKIAANALCELFGGGGHARAAGARIDGIEDISAVEDFIVGKVISALESGIGAEGNE